MTFTPHNGSPMPSSPSSRAPWGLSILMLATLLLLLWQSIARPAKVRVVAPAAPPACEPLPELPWGCRWVEVCDG